MNAVVYSVCIYGHRIIQCSCAAVRVQRVHVYICEVLKHIVSTRVIHKVHLDDKAKLVYIAMLSLLP